MLFVDVVGKLNMVLASPLYATMRADLIVKNNPIAVLVLLRSVKNQVLDLAALVFFHAGDLRAIQDK